MSNTQQNNEVAVIPATQDESNTPALIEYGQQAINALKSGLTSLGKANALFTYVIAQAWITEIFECKIAYKEGAEMLSFEMHNVADRDFCKKSDGKNDNLKSKAMSKCIAMDLFGLDDDFTPAQKNTFNQCLDVVTKIKALGYDLNVITLSKKSNNLCVPYELMNNEPKADNENKFNEYQTRKGTAFVLDGKDKSTFAELRRRLTPKTEKGAEERNTPSKGASLLANTKFVTNTLKELLDEKTSKDMGAPTEEMRREFHALYIQLGKYFTADPMESKETGSKPAKDKKAA